MSDSMPAPDPPGAPRVVVVGDVVAGRRFVDDRRLHAGIAAALDSVNAEVAAVEPLTRSLRDEFHGVYRDIATAAAAVLRLRLATDDLVLPTADGVDEPVELRLGLGIGTAYVRAGTPSGSAWYHARDARDEAEALAHRRTWPASLRGRCRSDAPQLAGIVNAYLLLQDQLLARLDARDRRALLGLLDGERQVDVAAELGVTQPAIARRLRDRGALAIHRALLELHACTVDPARVVG